MSEAEEVRKACKAITANNRLKEEKEEEEEK